MAINREDTVDVNIVVWPTAKKFLSALANKEYRLAAEAPTEFERGRHAGRGKMCEELQNLPEALALLEAEDRSDNARR